MRPFAAGIAEVPYTKWVRWMLPLQGLLLALGLALLAVAIMIGYH